MKRSRKAGPGSPGFYPAPKSCILAGGVKFIPQPTRSALHRLSGGPKAHSVGRHGQYRAAGQGNNFVPFAIRRPSITAARLPRRRPYRSFAGRRALRDGRPNRTEVRLSSREPRRPMERTPQVVATILTCPLRYDLGAIGGQYPGVMSNTNQNLCGRLMPVSRRSGCFYGGRRVSDGRQHAALKPGFRYPPTCRHKVLS